MIIGASLLAMLYTAKQASQRQQVMTDSQCPVVVGLISYRLLGCLPVDFSVLARAPHEVESSRAAFAPAQL